VVGSAGKMVPRPVPDPSDEVEQSTALSCRVSNMKDMGNVGGRERRGATRDTVALLEDCVRTSQLVCCGDEFGEVGIG
jgi:hypothetical protein